MQKILLLITIFFIFISVSFAGNNSEVEKLQWHLDRVESILREVETSNLTEKIFNKWNKKKVNRNW